MKKVVEEVDAANAIRRASIRKTSYEEIMETEEKSR